MRFLNKAKLQAKPAAFVFVLTLLLAAATAGFIQSRKAPLVIAVAESFSGIESHIGPQVLRGDQMAVDEANQAGGIDGHPIRLQVFDDGSNAATAAANVEAIAASPAIAVLGHFGYLTAPAAGPGYRAARIPALTGLCTTDVLTKDNPYYFRSNYLISEQGREVAYYLDDVLHVPSLTIIYPTNILGRTYLGGLQTYKGKLHLIPFDPKAKDKPAAIRAVVTDLLANSKQDSMFLFATVESDSFPINLAIRRAGLTTPLIGNRNFGRPAYAERFTSEPEEQTHPGYFTDGMLAPTPLMLDSLGEQSQSFVETYQRRYKKRPDWVQAKAYEATKILIRALQGAHVQDTPNSRGQDREAVRGQLAAINSPSTAVSGLSGPLYFNAHHDMDVPIRIGTFKRREFYSAPLQMVLVNHPEVLDIENLVASGRILKEGDQYFWKQRVVYTGIDFNKVGRLDFKTNTFSADFFLWMRYSGDDVPTHINFPGLVKPEDFNFEAPLEASDDDGLHYRLYRIIGEFRASYDLHSYPFDTQDLRVQLQNNDLPRDQVTYVTDVRGLREGDSDVPYKSLSSWEFKGIHYTVDSLVSESTRGRTEFFDTPARIDYPGFSAHVSLRRVYSVFILKSMVALGLLTLVVFTTLFLGSTFSKERLTIPVTAILASAVLLTGINNQVSDVGYIMAVEYAFYMFFGLCLFVMIVTIAEHPASPRKQVTAQSSVISRVRRKMTAHLNLIAKIGYIVTVAGTLCYFWIAYVHP